MEHADATAVKRALSGDRRALRVLVDRLMPIVRARVWRAMARGGVVRGGDVDDLVQEIWLGLMGHGGRRLLAFDPSKGTTLEGYVGLLTEHEIANHRERVVALKRGAGVKGVELSAIDEVPSPAPSPEEFALGKEIAARLGEHLERSLPARGRLVLRHTFTDGRSAADTAGLMGVDVQVIYNWQHKIRESVRAFLAG